MWLLIVSNLVFACSLIFLVWDYLRTPLPDRWLNLVFILVGLLVLLYSSPWGMLLRGGLNISPSLGTFANDPFSLTGAFVFVLGLFGFFRPTPTT
jgi:hypothetical protein